MKINRAKKCVVCGKEYNTKSYTSKTCSKLCSRKYTKLISVMESRARTQLVKKHFKEYKKYINDFKKEFLYLK